MNESNGFGGFVLTLKASHTSMAEVKMLRGQIGGNWHILKGKVRQQWGMLTNQDLDRLTAGYEEELTGKIQRAYGISKKEADEKLKEWYRLRNAPQDINSSINSPSSRLS